MGGDPPPDPPPLIVISGVAFANVSKQSLSNSSTTAPLTVIVQGRYQAKLDWFGRQPSFADVTPKTTLTPHPWQTGIVDCTQWLSDSACCLLAGVQESGGYGYKEKGKRIPEVHLSFRVAMQGRHATSTGMHWKLGGGTPPASFRAPSHTQLQRHL